MNIVKKFVKFYENWHITPEPPQHYGSPKKKKNTQALPLNQI